MIPFWCEVHVLMMLWAFVISMVLGRILLGSEIAYSIPYMVSAWVGAPSGIWLARNLTK